jgi:hypothetical protein
MVEEKRYEGAKYPFKLLLEESLTQRRNEIMDNLSHILQRLSTTVAVPSTSSHFGGEIPFKVQVNFDIPLFECHRDVDALGKWLSLLEGYFFIQNSSNSETITSALLKSLPHVRYWWETYCEKHVENKSTIFGPKPT